LFVCLFCFVLFCFFWYGEGCFFKDQPEMTKPLQWTMNKKATDDLIAWMETKSYP
jgi:hypothetical protein